MMRSSSRACRRWARGTCICIAGNAPRHHHVAATSVGHGSARYPDGHRGIQTQALHDRLEQDAALVESGELVPGADVVIEPPDV